MSRILLSPECRPFVITTGLLVLAAGLLPSLLAASVGILLTSLTRPSSSGAISWTLAFGLVLVTYLATQAIGPVTTTVSGELGARFVRSVRELTAAAASGPVGVAHLEDARFADAVHRLSEADSGWGDPTRYVAAATQLWTARLTGVGGLVLLAAFRLWAPIVLLPAIAAQRYWARRDVDIFVESDENAIPQLRRSTYERSLAILPSAAKEVRTFSLDRWLVDRLQQQWVEGMASIWARRRENKLALILSGVSVGVGLALVAWMVAAAAASGAITIGRLVTTFQGALLTLQLGYAGDSETTVRKAGPLIAKAVDLHLLAPDTIAPLSSAGRIFGGPVNMIEFDHVSFRYPGTNQLVLCDMSLRIPIGRSLAIVGPNGSGKTTLIKLLARLHDPTEGSILVDGTPLTEIDPALWRRHLAVLFQDFVHYELSLRYNIGLARSECLDDGEALQTAADRAGLGAVRERVGWEAPLSPSFAGGVSLSAGEWQRVGLARIALATSRQANVVVLDEPTANLDVRAEAAVFNRLLSAEGATVLLVSHRLSSVRRADLIVVLGDGGVAEQGTHSELMAADGHYARMFRAQARRFEAGASRG